jgi:23S rRNA (uracil1939-C5)-methyltransferase
LARVRAPLVPGDVVSVEVTGVAHDGAGVGRADGLAVFVPGTVPGDLALVRVSEVRRTFAVAKLVSVERASEVRVDPGCPSFGRCGGCQLRHVAYHAQLSFKTRRVREAFRRIGHIADVDVAPCLPAPVIDGYRNRVQFALDEKADGTRVVGFRPAGTHLVVDVDLCGLAMGEVNEAGQLLRKVLNSPEGSGIRVGPESLHHAAVRVSSCTKEVMVILVTASRDLSGFDAVARSLAHLKASIVSVHVAVSPARKGANWLGRASLLHGRETITECVRDRRFIISAESFFQVNLAQTERLVDTVEASASLTGTETLLDVYCGTGLMSICLAGDCAHVVGVEAVQEAVRDARVNARANRVGNAQFIAGRAETILGDLMARGLKPDVVVLDPPRAGCDREVLVATAEMKPSRAVYVSCDPETLARDLGFLNELGYRTRSVQPLDMFPNTSHVEAVALITPDPR